MVSFFHHDYGTGSRKTFLLLILFMSFWASSFSQTFKLSGILTDGKDKQTLIGVVLRLNHLNDSTNTMDAVSDVDGSFVITGLSSGKYLLQASYVGYQPMSQIVQILNADLNLGTLIMVQTSSGLKGVTVTAEQIRAQQNGDTSQFNADAYKTNRDATAEELVTKMPGVTTDNGAVKVNGEDVKKVLVDGKEFFGDDPNAALKNLPAEIVDKIQVFDRASDQSQFSGFDDGNSQKTINIITKRGKNNGVFGKITAGYGFDDENNDGRYTVGGNINFFNGDRRISLVGLANNVNQQNFSSEDLLGVSSSSSSGSGRGAGGRGGGGGPAGGGGNAASNFLVSQQGGITTTQSAGINYSDQWGKNLKVTASYFFNRSDNENNTSLTRNYITNNPDSSLVYTEKGLNSSINYNHRASLRLEWTVDSNNSIILNPKISYQDNNTSKNLMGINTLGESGTQSSLNNQTQALTSGYTFSNQLTLRHRMAKPGRTISLNLGTSYNLKSGNGTLYSQNQYADSSLNDITDQHYDLQSNGLGLSANLSYTEPLTKNSQFLVTYSPSYNHKNSDRETYNRTGSNYTDLDTSLSNKYNNDYYYQRGGLGYRFNTRKMNFNASLNAQYATLTGSQSFPTSFDINRNFTDLLPQAMLNYKFSKTENIRIMYRTNTDAPDITQLQNIVDNSNPLLLRTGNPDLRQDYTHSLIIRYGKTSPGSGNGLFLFANGTIVSNYIGSSTIIALNDTSIRGVVLNRGSQLSIPVNLNGNYSARSFLTYSLPLKPIKTNLNLNAGINYSRTPAIINGQENFANNYTFNGGFVAGSNISENVDFTLSSNGAYNIVKNSLQAQNNFNYYSQTTALRLNYIFLKNFVFNTNVTHTFYSGLGSTYDQQYILWNASLGYKFLKSKAMQVDLYAFDLLKQNRAISRTITESYIEDDQTQVLQRYFMLRLTYTLRSFKSGGMPENPGDNPMRQGHGDHHYNGRGAPGGGYQEQN